MVSENDQKQQQSLQQAAKSMETDKTLGDSFKESNNTAENSDNLVESMNNSGEVSSDLPTSSKGKLNDLVADLCLNGHESTAGQKSQTNAHSFGGAYGDYTNIRATSGPVGVNENNFHFVGGCNMGSDNNEASYVNTNSTTSHNVQQQQQPTQNSSFSFKHFLSSNNVPTAPSTTVTSLDPPANSTSTTSSNAITSSRSLQTSTGARPKVPQSSSVSSTSISSLSVGGANETQSSATKMKRSPRFSSFDSQASLAEYAGSSTTTTELPAEEVCGAGSSNTSTDFRLYPDERERDRFQEWNFPSNAPTMTTNSTDYDRNSSYVPRSYSNYEMPRPQTSPRRRVGIGATTKDSRPTRLSLNSNQNPTTAAKLKLDLPLASNSIGGSSGISTRKNVHSNRPTDFLTSNPIPGGAAAAAALPDFVQDHWMDSWYANDMHVNSPPSSPIPTFIEDLTGLGQASGNCIGHAAGNTTNRTLHIDNAPIPGPADRGDFNIGLPEPSSSSVGSKMLPDFLSDGPIIHSSQRLADVAAGLPSNSVGSPEESSINKQLSRLRLDNERLQRELNETRLALNEQTLRANNFERQLIDQQRQHKTETEESCDSNKKHTTAVQSLVTKLKQQIQQLTTEVKMLKRENELMREEGAVGGHSVKSCDRAAVSSSTHTSEATAAIPVAGSDITSAAGIRPSRQQQLSRDLRRAASNAEQNLKQLLVGVENLRQMASNIEKSERHIDYDASPDLFSDFLDECDDYDKYPDGGPAL